MDIEALCWFGVVLLAVCRWGGIETSLDDGKDNEWEA